MKKYTIILFYMLSCIVTTTYADRIVMIKNEYKDPIIFNINGQDAAIIRTGTEERLYNWQAPYTFKIRTERGRYYDSIQKEIDKVRNAAITMPNFYTTITILNSSNILDFKYQTSIKPMSDESMRKVLFEEVYQTENIYPLLQWIYNNRYVLFPSIIAKKLFLIENAISQSGPNPIEYFKRDIIKALYQIVKTKQMTEETFIKKEIPSIINRIFNNMVIDSRTPGKITFKPTDFDITPKLLEDWRIIES